MTTHSAKRAKTTAAMALVLCALLALIAWMEFGGAKPQGSNETINNIVLSRAGHPDIKLSLQNEQWRMTSPYSLNSNPQRVEALLKIPTSLGKQYAIDETDLSATGLDSPQASVRLNETSYFLGKIDLSGDRRYVQSGESMSLLPEWVWSLVHGGTTAFADLSVFSNLSEPLHLQQQNNADNKLRPLNNIELWKSLQADKIVAPVDTQQDNESIQRFALLDSEDPATANVLAEIVRLADYAIVQTHSEFGYAISNVRLDALLAP